MHATSAPPPTGRSTPAFNLCLFLYMLLPSVSRCSSYSLVAKCSRTCTGSREIQHPDAICTTVVRKMPCTVCQHRAAATRPGPLCITYCRQPPLSYGLLPFTLFSRSVQNSNALRQGELPALLPLCLRIVTQVPILPPEPMSVSKCSVKLYPSVKAHALICIFRGHCAKRSGRS